MSALPESPLHELLQILSGLCKSTGENGPTAGGSLYLAWAGPFLGPEGSMPGELLSDLCDLLPKPGTLEVLSRSRSQVLRLDRPAAGGISMQSLPPRPMGPQGLIADWPEMETLLWVPGLPPGAADAIAAYLEQSGHELLLHLPSSMGIAVLVQGHIRHRILLQQQTGYHDLTSRGLTTRWVSGSWPVPPLEGHPSRSEKETAMRWIAPLGSADAPGILASSDGSQTQPCPVKGVLRGPWNFTGDFHGDDWNRHLFAHAAEMMLKALRQISCADDPALPLDLLPDDEFHPLATALWQGAIATPLVPDGTCTLRLGRQLWSHPYNDPRIASYWRELAAPMAHRRVVHPSCLTSSRLAALGRLSQHLAQEEARLVLDSPALRPWDLTRWFGNLVPAGPAVARRVLDLALLCKAATSASLWEQTRGSLQIIRTAGEHFLSAGEVYFPQEGGFVPDDQSPVHKDLLADHETRAILTEVLGVTPPLGLAPKLVKILGPHAAALLRSGLKGHVPEDLTQSLTAHTLAEVALGLHGNAVLSALSSALKKTGYHPPARWGGHAARTFVHSLGFPEAFAIAGSSMRPSEEYLMGPEELPPLHDFQQEVYHSVRELVDSPASTSRRAVITLPTGGGKTRVTVQAAVDLILKPAGSQCQVLWVAQTDELCEQAVQAFRQVWAQRGRSRAELRIVRLWGGHRSAAPPENSEPVAVVASIQTLTNQSRRNQELSWLRRCGMVVVDECHHAIAPTYTRILNWMKKVVPSPVAAPPVILGLSATPFRNAYEESLRLAERFDQRLLPSRQEDLYQRLLDRGVLAQAVYSFIESGSLIDEEDLSVLEAVEESQNPIKFENRVRSINRKLAADSRRNELIVDEIRACGQRSILLFANSPSHSKQLAAMLIARGISAAAIDAKTPRSARRWLLDRFQRHEIRVLCNHSVLTTGFDAPKVDMVFISRQVFSPVRYMQMVGRGLRGPLNGGTAECRIVTVRDNWLKYGDRLAWHYWEEFFRPAPA